MGIVNDLRAKRDRARARRKAALARGDERRAASALRLIRRLRYQIASILKSRAARCPSADATYHSPKRWDSRAPIQPRLIVLHSTESPPGSGKGVSSYLARSDIQADAHVVIDDDGWIARLVPDGRKAWTQAAYNSVSLSIEQVGRASQSFWPQKQLDAVARQIACWSRKYGIPIKHASPTGTGVIRHSDLGAPGGGHHDPGAGYPLARVLELARRYR